MISLLITAAYLVSHLKSSRLELRQNLSTVFSSFLAAEFPRLGIEPKTQLWQYWILKPLCHKGTLGLYLLTRHSEKFWFLSWKTGLPCSDCVALRPSPPTFTSENSPGNQSSSLQTLRSFILPICEFSRYPGLEWGSHRFAGFCFCFISFLTHVRLCSFRDL